MNLLFVFKKIAAALLLPFPLSLMLIVVGIVLLWLNRRGRLAKYLVTAGAGLLLIFSNSFVGYHLTHDLEGRYPPLGLAQPDKGDVSASGQTPTKTDIDLTSQVRELGPVPSIVVLSGGASNDPELPDNDRLSSTSALRVAQAVEIYRAFTSSSALNTDVPLSDGKADQTLGPRVILSGGRALDAVPEAIPMQKLAESLGIPPNDIYMETQSDDTFSEAKNIFQLVGSRPFILVTSAIHMPRAIALFRHFGMRPIPAPADYEARKTGEPFVMQISPSTKALDQSTAVWHERMGMFWERLRGQL